MSADDRDIQLDAARLLRLPAHADVFRWAVLYENQRGITLFSTPYYSRLSLLPTDPQPFTVPHTASTRSRQPNLSLDNYPLPDATWRWVSAAWMVDMRTDRCEVQHDGFEYNWLFRDKHWHPDIGTLSAGAWVRRRRWVRLMMRPAQRSNVENTVSSSPCPSSPVLHPPLADLHREAAHVWEGGDHDWQRVHRLLRRLGRDGRKLELWRLWLAPYAQAPASDLNAVDAASLKALGKRPSDVVPEGNPPPLVHLVAILRNHGKAILHSFVFPDSRAQFVDLVRRAGLAEDLESCLGRALSTADVDFWSYAHGLDAARD